MEVPGRKRRLLPPDTGAAMEAGSKTGIKFTAEGDSEGLGQKETYTEKLTDYRNTFLALKGSEQVTSVFTQKNRWYSFWEEIRVIQEKVVHFVGPTLTSHILIELLTLIRRL